MPTSCLLVEERDDLGPRPALSRPRTSEVSSRSESSCTAVHAFIKDRDFLMEHMLSWGKQVLASQPFSVLLGAELLGFSEDGV